MGLLDELADQIGEVIDVPDVPDIDIGMLTRVVELVWDNKVAIVDLVTRLPTLLGDAGEQMQTAGDAALTASRFLSGARSRA